MVLLAHSHGQPKETHVDGNPILTAKLLAVTEPNTPLWLQCFNAVHPMVFVFDEEIRGPFLRKCAVGAWFDAALSLVPTDRALRMHRYRNNKSGWASVTSNVDGKHFPMDDPGNPGAMTAQEFFVKAEFLEAAIMIIAIRCAETSGK
jgi:hypothetical protein